MTLLDAYGVPLAGGVPRVLSATFCRSAYMRGQTEDIVVTGDGQDARVETKQGLVRAQIPHLVTLIVYQSKFQMQGAEREYFVYAPGDMVSSVKLAFKLWRKWEKPNRPGDTYIEPEDDYPKVEDGAVSQPIDDAFFAEMWQAVQRNGKYRAAGDPTDPFAFTSLDPSIRVFRTEDFQKGLEVTL